MKKYSLDNRDSVKQSFIDNRDRIKRYQLENHDKLIAQKRIFLIINISPILISVYLVEQEAEFVKHYKEKLNLLQHKII